jgi:uncharacterized membrane protein YkvA (DUF1232 family)
MDPKKLKRWLILLAVLYLVFPRDLIPDFFGRGLGLIDDLLLVALLTYFYRKRLRDHAARSSRESPNGDSQKRASREQAATSAGPPDPYEVLGVPSSASAEAIQAAYKARMQKYHPDKVAHLGEELQELAHHKALEIQEAYRRVRRPLGDQRRRP